MEHFAVPTRVQQEDFLVQLYFGDGSDYLHLCVNRAYLDLSRTLHGIGEMPNLRGIATDEVKKALVTLRGNVEITNQVIFDEWHYAACTHLCSTYKRHGYPYFHVGQAQKWLNMSLKYIYVIGDKRLPGYSHLYQFGHAPLDGYLIRYLHDAHGAPQLSVAWSQLDYKEYLRFQQWIRDNSENSAPLAVEFYLWPEAKRSES